MLVVFPMPGIPWKMPPIESQSGTSKTPYRNDDMRTVSVLRDDLEPLNRLLVSDDIVQNLRSILFYPTCTEGPRKKNTRGSRTMVTRTRCHCWREPFPSRWTKSFTKARVVSVTCDPDAQHLTRLAGTLAKSFDHILEGRFVVIPTPVTRVNEMLFHSQGTTLGVSAQAAPRLPLDRGKCGVQIPQRFQPKGRVTHRSYPNHRKALRETEGSLGHPELEETRPVSDG